MNKSKQQETIVPASIRLEGLQITKVDFRGKEFHIGDPNNTIVKFELEYHAALLSSNSEEDKHHFGIIFTSTIVGADNSLELDIEATAIFESTIPVDDDFLNSSFAKINAPAIAFPYLRSFVSTLTLNAGYSPIVLPSINFVKSTEKENMASPENK